MKYIPEKMLNKSRFSVLYNNSDNSAKHFVTEKISQYINENPQYCDNKNYVHLCNLFAALAFEAFFEQNCSRAKAIEKIKNAMYKYLEPSVRKMQRLSENPFFIPFLKLTMPLKFKCTCGYGWEIEYPNADKNEFAMTTRECIYCKIFSKYGIFELSEIFCKVDDFLYSNLPGADFLYTEQLGTGGSMCDYTFRKKGDKMIKVENKSQE
ncbi:MAG: L-2-amino-thiazoline-4-carboxylic acid hydrolase [Oscillospiraceae bacterium]|nr:L-2-amino-thiazoline-4-carboxylic acid hydrolase [Oscillospiraceae bacterium]